MAEQRNGRIMRKYRNVLTYEDEYANGWLPLTLGSNVQGIILVHPDLNSRTAKVIGQITAVKDPALVSGDLVATCQDGWKFSIPNTEVLGFNKAGDYSQAIISPHYLQSDINGNLIIGSSNTEQIRNNADTIIINNLVPNGKIIAGIFTNIGPAIFSITA